VQVFIAAGREGEVTASHDFGDVPIAAPNSFGQSVMFLQPSDEEPMGHDIMHVE